MADDLIGLQNYEAAIRLLKPRSLRGKKDIPSCPDLEAMLGKPIWEWTGRLG